MVSSYRHNDIVIVGMACRFPGAPDLTAFWDNILACRRAFRKIPAERLSERYIGAEGALADKSYVGIAAVLEGFEFDRTKFKVSAETYRTVDHTHWLALTVAEEALSNAGIVNGSGIDKTATGVIIGNSLTGEFSRAQSLRLRWPYVEQVLYNQLNKNGRPDTEIRNLIADVEKAYKAPFPAVNEETLAGGLSNTIAGRICNYFDFKGGGYTTDGACSSSLLAVAQACTALVAGDLEVVLAGGVDLSLDPFELIGFSAAEALAKNEMLVYDHRSRGFWPGEGCGFVVMMLAETAISLGLKPYAKISGWGISSDGNGGLTRPEQKGQILALHRAYSRAGYAISSLGYIEGHGTGTAVGDKTELSTLLAEIQEAGSPMAPISLGSVKSLIGHTKAAAGIAGLIKAALSTFYQIIPAHTGCVNPHPLLLENENLLTIPKFAELWPAHTPLRAGVSSMGFGGINVHITLEGIAGLRRDRKSKREIRLDNTYQDSEIFLFSQHTLTELTEQIKSLRTIAVRLSFAEMATFSKDLIQQSDHGGLFKAAIIAASPQELVQNLKKLEVLLGEENSEPVFLPREGIFYANNSVGKSPKLVFLFPGQGSNRLPEINNIIRRQLQGHLNFNFPETACDNQQLLVKNSLLYATVLQDFGIQPECAIGHSLGEYTALCWADALPLDEMLELVGRRNQLITATQLDPGSMISIAAGSQMLQDYLIQFPLLSIAGYNAPERTVISGRTEDIKALEKQLRDAKIASTILPVGHAFHSPMMESVKQPFSQTIAEYRFGPLKKTVISTVSGSRLPEQLSFPAHLSAHLTEPVRFWEAFSLTQYDADFYIEIGAGHMLTDLLSENNGARVLSVDISQSGCALILKALGAWYALNGLINLEKIYEHRELIPIETGLNRYFANPCEYYNNNAPVPEIPCLPDTETEKEAALGLNPPELSVIKNETSIIELIRDELAAKLEIPVAAIIPQSRMLDDLHLNSITVSQFLLNITKKLNIKSLANPTEYSNASIMETAQAIEQLISAGPADGDAYYNEEINPAGVQNWVRHFIYKWKPNPLNGKPTENWRSILNKFTVIGPEKNEQIEKLINEGAGTGTKGIITVLPPDLTDELTLEYLWNGVQSFLELQEKEYFVLIHSGKLGPAFVKSMFLEFPTARVATICIYPGIEVAEIVVQEITNGSGFTECKYDEKGLRYTEVPEVEYNFQDRKQFWLERKSVLLVSGGGKGITAECAFDIAVKHDLRLAILGRSEIQIDDKLATNLSRAKKMGINVFYQSVDVRNKEKVADAIRIINQKWGVISGIVHGAGQNNPVSLKNIDPESFKHSWAVKVTGLQNILDCINPDELQLLVTFGSIIGRAGMWGNADYALANEGLRVLTDRWHVGYPACKSICIEWSLWAGTGMGDSLGVLEQFQRLGIPPITIDEGINSFSQIISADLPWSSVLVTGRWGNLPTIPLPTPPAPIFRFIENMKVFYPGVEVVCDCNLSPATDLYLKDHCLDGNMVFPGVIGLEAMAQTASMLVNFGNCFSIKNIIFESPLIISDNNTLKIRISALKIDEKQVKTVIRSEATSFTQDHFSAVFEYEIEEAEFIPHALLNGLDESERGSVINPREEIYGNLLFHGPLFQKITEITCYSPHKCQGRIDTRQTENWFSGFLPNSLLLGNPGVRDAFIHAIQPCVPGVTLLPHKVESIMVSDPEHYDTISVRAIERNRDDSSFIYDLIAWSDKGNVIEKWSGLKLNIIQKTPRGLIFSSDLLQIHLSQKLLQLGINGQNKIYVAKTQKEARQLFPSFKRLDGKRQIVKDKGLIAHSSRNDYYLISKGNDILSCDIENNINFKGEDLDQLLGNQHFTLAKIIADQFDEDARLSAMRVWSAKECLKKSGSWTNDTILFNKIETDNWIVLESSGHKIYTYLFKSIERYDSVVTFMIKNSQV